MRYLVKVSVYSLLPGEVGRILVEGIHSRHRSLRAAGRELGSLISGKQRLRATPNTALHMYIHDTATGEHISRNQAR
jgi:hypothetical protein